MNEKRNEYMREYYKKNREKLKARVKKYRDNNPEKARACVTRYREKNLEKSREYIREWHRSRPKEITNALPREWARKNPERRKEINRNCRLKKQYGITIEDYNAMLDSQGGGCAICSARPETIHHGTLCVDHDHETGAVRGILCDRCNRAIGLLKDDPARVAAMLQYLTKTF